MRKTPISPGAAVLGNPEPISPYNRAVTRRAVGIAAVVLVGGIEARADAPAVPVPQEITCPAGLTRRDAAPLIDAFPPIHGVGDGQHCRRSDGVPQGPTVAWHYGRKRLAMVGSYCDGQAQGQWSFFWPNGSSSCDCRATPGPQSRKGAKNSSPVCPREGLARASPAKFLTGWYAR